MARWWRAEVRGRVETGRSSGEIKEEEWPGRGRTGETGQKVCKQAAREQIRGDFFLGEPARRKQEGGGGWKCMSMRPDDPETGEAQAHKNALCVPPATPHFYPSVFLSLIVCFSVYFPPSLRCLFLRRRRATALWCFGWLCVVARGHGSHISLMGESLMSTRPGGLSTSLQLHVRGK